MPKWSKPQSTVVPPGNIRHTIFNEGNTVDVANHGHVNARVTVEFERELTIQERILDAIDLCHRNYVKPERIELTLKDAMAFGPISRADGCLAFGVGVVQVDRIAKSRVVWNEKTSSPPPVRQFRSPWPDPLMATALEYNLEGSVTPPLGLIQFAQFLEF